MWPDGKQYLFCIVVPLDKYMDVSIEIEKMKISIYSLYEAIRKVKNLGKISVVCQDDTENLENIISFIKNFKQQYDFDENLELIIIPYESIKHKAFGSPKYNDVMSKTPLIDYGTGPLYVDKPSEHLFSAIINVSIRRNLNLCSYMVSTVYDTVFHPESFLWLIKILDFNNDRNIYIGTRKTMLEEDHIDIITNQNMDFQEKYKYIMEKFDEINETYWDVLRDEYKGAAGNFMVIPSVWCEKVRGFAEHLPYYGYMDTEIVEKLVYMFGLDIVNIKNKYKKYFIIHLGHKERRKIGNILNRHATFDVLNEDDWGIADNLIVI